MIRGRDLRQLLRHKWGYSYDLQLRQVQGAIVLQVMWKYLEQVSFPLTEQEYLDRLDWIAQHLVAWDSVDKVVHFIETTSDRPRVGKAVTISLDLGERASEWLSVSD